MGFLICLKKIKEFSNLRSNIQMHLSALSKDNNNHYQAFLRKQPHFTYPPIPFCRPSNLWVNVNMTSVTSEYIIEFIVTTWGNKGSNDLNVKHKVWRGPLRISYCLHFFSVFIFSLSTKFYFLLFYSYVHDSFNISMNMQYL